MIAKAPSFQLLALKLPKTATFNATKEWINSWRLMWINSKKMQFIHSVNGDGSKTAEIFKKGDITHHHIT